MSDREWLGVLRLPVEMLNALIILHREKPNVCFTMNPSIFASWWLSILARIYRFRLVTDLHTPNIRLSGTKRKLFEMIFKQGVRRSDIVIVTNEIYRQTIESINSNIVIVPDPLPDLNYHDRSKVHRDNDSDKGKKFRVLFICSFDPDEPVEEVLSLDAELDDFEVIVSGNWKKMFRTLPELKNISFSGFLSRDDYDSLLFSADGIMTLTNKEGCLCCGAYEAFSAGKPMILSDTNALRQYFGEAPIYTINSSVPILEALKRLSVERVFRAHIVERERTELIRKFKMSVNLLEQKIAELL
jgi:glycosyltransferase involved in cell wall biosynthesis